MVVKAEGWAGGRLGKLELPIAELARKSSTTLQGLPSPASSASVDISSGSGHGVSIVPAQGRTSDADAGYGFGAGGVLDDAGAGAGGNGGIVGGGSGSGGVGGTRILGGMELLFDDDMVDVSNAEAPAAMATTSLASVRMASFPPKLKSSTWTCFFCKKVCVSTNVECLRCGQTGEQSRRAVQQAELAKTKPAKKKSGLDFVLQRPAAEFGEWQCHFCFMVNQREDQAGRCNLCEKRRAMYAVDASTSEAEDKEKVLERIVGCEIVTLVGSHAGVLTISTTHVTFCANYLTVDLEDIVSGVDIDDRKQSGAADSFRYMLKQIRFVLPRRHLHRDSAIAVFLQDIDSTPSSPSSPSSTSAFPAPFSLAAPSPGLVALSTKTPTVLLNFYRAELPAWQVLSIFESASPSLLSPVKAKQKAVVFASKKSYTPHQTIAAPNAHEVQKKVSLLLSTLLSLPSPLSNAKWLSGSSITQKWQRREIRYLIPFYHPFTTLLIPSSHLSHTLTPLQVLTPWQQLRLSHDVESHCRAIFPRPQPVSGNCSARFPHCPQALPILFILSLPYLHLSVKVMPWVLTDFSSRKLDLTNPRVFRDLSLPIGALNPKRWAMLHERFEAWEDDAHMPRFHYGSHYSRSTALLLTFHRIF
jgi:hypothetical protein